MKRKYWLYGAALIQSCAVENTTPAKSDCGFSFWLKQIFLFGFCRILPKEKGEASVLLLVKQLECARPSCTSKFQTGENSQRYSGSKLGLRFVRQRLFHLLSRTPIPLHLPAKPLAGFWFCCKYQGAVHPVGICAPSPFIPSPHTAVCPCVAFPVWIKGEFMCCL